MIAGNQLHRRGSVAKKSAIHRDIRPLRVGLYHNGTQIAAFGLEGGLALMG